MLSMAGRSSNKSLQGTFDPPPIFATAKTGVASNDPELRRYTALYGVSDSASSSARLHF
jgi:hypothetical protein